MGDIAYHLNKFKTRGFDRCINVWGADHHGHIARLKAAMQAAGVNPDHLEIVIMQLVRLMRDGEIARMSKRKGEMITPVSYTHLDVSKRQGLRWWMCSPALNTSANT